MPGDSADGVDNTTYFARTELTLNGNQFSVDTMTIQRRMSGTCSSGGGGTAEAGQAVTTSSTCRLS